MLLKSAFTGKTKRVKQQALVTLQIKNIALDQIILISPQLVTPLLLGMDFCMENSVVINFPKSTLIINADVQENATEVDLVVDSKTDGDIHSPISRAIHLKTADCPSIPQLDCGAIPPRSDPTTQSYNGRLPEGDVCLNCRTVGKTTLSNGVYDPFSEAVEVSTNTKGIASIASTPNECNDRNNTTAKGKYEHTDANIVRSIEIRSLTLEHGRGADGKATTDGRSDLRTRCEYDVGGLDKQDDHIVSLDRLRIDEHLSN